VLLLPIKAHAQKQSELAMVHHNALLASGRMEHRDEGQRFADISAIWRVASSGTRRAQKNRAALWCGPGLGYQRTVDVMTTLSLLDRSASRPVDFPVRSSVVAFPRAAFPCVRAARAFYRRLGQIACRAIAAESLACGECRRRPWLRPCRHPPPWTIRSTAGRRSSGSFLSASASSPVMSHLSSPR